MRRDDRPIVRVAHIRGQTFVETCVALSIGLVALGGAAAIVSAAGRMSAVSSLSGALAEGALALATIHRDLVAAVRRPDAPEEPPVRVGVGHLQVLCAGLRTDGSITATLVAYRTVRVGSSLHGLARRAQGKERRLPGIYHSVRFVALSGAGGPYVKVELHVIGPAGRTIDRGGLASKDAVLSCLARVAGPEMLGSSSLTWDFMGALRGMAFGDAP